MRNATAPSRFAMRARSRANIAGHSAEYVSMLSFSVITAGSLAPKNGTRVTSRCREGARRSSLESARLFAWLLRRSLTDEVTPDECGSVVDDFRQHRPVRTVLVRRPRDGALLRAHTGPSRDPRGDAHRASGRSF